MVSKFGRAVVTGGAGFLGSRVCRRLLEQGTAVVCLDNFLTGGRAEAKRYAETLTTAYGRAGHADTAIARIFDSYGPGMRPDDGRMVGASATLTRPPSARSPCASSVSPGRPRPSPTSPGRRTTRCP